MNYRKTKQKEVEKIEKSGERQLKEKKRINYIKKKKPVSAP
jgi:hypothetical protein